METVSKGKGSHTPRLGKRGFARLADSSKNVYIMLFSNIMILNTKFFV